MKGRVARRLQALFLITATLWPVRDALALDPRKGLTQYSHTVWTQEHGLPQETIRAITQTTDGYLWIGTDEGLARFDGYDFTVFNNAKGDLPANAITALASGADGSLWIGTSNGLTHYRNKRFITYTVKQGLPDNAISQLYTDHAGTLWIVAGVSLSRFDAGQFRNFAPDRDIPVTSVRVVHESRRHDLWVAGFSGVVKMAGGKFVPVIQMPTLNSDVITCMLEDRQGNLWIGGSSGLIERSPTGRIRRYDARMGLPDTFVRALLEDRDGNLWVGTNGGIARLEGDRFLTAPGGGTRDDLVRCLFEDREGNLWVGANNGLTRLRDAAFTVYGKSEGLPSDQPNTVAQDRQGHIWVGFHDAGLMWFSPTGYRLFTTANGLPSDEIFSIRAAPSGDLLLATRGGLVRMHDGRFRTYVPPDSLGRRVVFDALEDPSGNVWLAIPEGLSVIHNGRFRNLISGGPVLAAAATVLCLARDGAIWTGTYGKGLWRVKGASMQHYTTADGLSNDQIRALYEDRGGTLWIGTFGGGLDALRSGSFLHFTAKDGLLSDNVVSIADDGQSLWLSTTRGICRVARRQIEDFAQHRLAALKPINYGVEDGLRSAQCSPGYPTSGGGYHTADGKMWFTTTRGLAGIDPAARRQPELAPIVHITEITADRRQVDLASAGQLPPGTERLQIRYTAVHLSAPERVQFFYRLEGLDKDWVRANSRRVINFNSLLHGQYRFSVRAELPDGPASEQSYAFTVLPQFYETLWFRFLCGAMLVAAGWAVYQLRLRQIRYRFALVLEERARLAREIHDTLAQGFVGISSQLDAVAMAMPDGQSPARKYLDIARKMARHSLTEARRSVMDLRASALEGQDLAAALQAGTRLWTAGSGVSVDVDISGSPAALPQEVEHNLLRIAQEAVANVLKHAGAHKIRVKLHMETRKLCLRVLDDGRGFEQDGVFSSGDGHFGLIGMRERAERLGGELRLASHPGEGTEVEVVVPVGRASRPARDMKE